MPPPIRAQLCPFLAREVSATVVVDVHPSAHADIVLLLIVVLRSSVVIGLLRAITAVGVAKMMIEILPADGSVREEAIDEDQMTSTRPSSSYDSG